MHEGQVDVSVEAVTGAIAEQVPELEGLPVERVASRGTVVAPFRVGESFVARVPFVPESDASGRAGLQAEFDHALFLAGRLPIEVPRPIAIGEPFGGYEGLWSLWTWVWGTSLDRYTDPDQGAPPETIEQDALARDLAAVIAAFHALPTNGRIWNDAGRGGRPLADSDEVREAIDAAKHLVDPAILTQLWERALAASPHEGDAVYLHGDPMPGNLIVRDGRLSGLVDISKPVFGDPAADLQPAWVVFDEPARTVFRDALNPTDAQWERGRGWALQMAIMGLAYYEHTNPPFSRMAARTIQRIAATP